MIDFGFISRLEGGLVLKGYVPEPDGGATESGVTIADGFDIGQRTEKELYAILPHDIAARLSMYSDLVGYDAQEAIKNTPLTVTEEIAKKISECSHDEAVTRIKMLWPYDAVPFDELSDECQTVIASVSFQYGSLAKPCPNFWKQITTGDWEGALRNLRNFGDNYPTRRNKEADLLESWLNKVNA